jgi:hypothetical protein
MKDGLSVFDAEGRLLTWNRQFPALLHLPETAIRRGMTLTEVQALLPAQIGDGSGGPALLAEYNTLRQQKRIVLNSPSAADGSLNFAAARCPAVVLSRFTVI